VKKNTIIIILCFISIFITWKLVKSNDLVEILKDNNVAKYDYMKEDAIRDIYREYEPCICPMVIDRYNSYYAVAIGLSAEVAGNGPIAIGMETKAFGKGAIAIGDYAVACGEKAIAIGAWSCAVGSGIEDIKLGSSNNDKLLNFLQSDLTEYTQQTVHDLIDSGLIRSDIPIIDTRKK